MQVLQWRLANGSAERLVAGEVRTVAITLGTAPQSATVKVVKKSTGAELVASTPATVNGSVVSYVLTVPVAFTDTLAVIFLCAIGAEAVGVAVEVPVTPT